MGRRTWSATGRGRRRRRSFRHSTWISSGGLVAALVPLERELSDLDGLAAQKSLLPIRQRHGASLDPSFDVAPSLGTSRTSCEASARVAGHVVARTPPPSF